MHLRRSFEVRLVRERGEPHVDFHFYDHNDGYAIVWELLLGKKGDRRVGAGRLLDHEWIDLELLRSWKQKCLATHGDESSNPFRIPQVLPAWLIDTVEKRLVPGTTAGTPAAAPPGGGQRTSVLREYGSRNLTYPEDALPGILGLLPLFWRSFPGGFLYGLPEINFEAALRFRRARQAAHTGWKRGYQAIPITQWYTHWTPCHMNRRPIRPRWHTVTERAGAEYYMWRREGWERKEFDAAKHMLQDECEYNEAGMMPIIPPEGLGKHIYKHPGLPGKEYWAPLPLGSEETCQLSSSPPQTPYILCVTKKGWFAVERVPDVSSADEKIVVDGRHVGRLKVQCESDKELLPMAGDEDAEKVEIELVAICRKQKPVTKGPEETGDAAQPTVTYSESYVNPRYRRLLLSSQCASHNPYGAEKADYKYSLKTCTLVLATSDPLSPSPMKRMISIIRSRQRMCVAWSVRMF
ncbi:hypothetical protein GGTG_04124 [Gaeumannomyces tritici R3-111a-1]|uniref:Uncharacterized protein n=1 Tax=Gaeumannomyces tritici (strain R3-111a-1) TaxID=644352 RepID=J3NS79_GAET3|nr:hypothetical protein GGTG_04124 [Gaeumannomyces tritici R3-111a-1]EJT79035.1 hypothetical protein GGTG_04124 [Gaeumannomyces tritici R3-111a-1]